MNIKAVFSDVDGTLVDDHHQMLASTKLAIENLQAKGVRFVIVSARSPSGIYPIQRKNSIKCPIISYSGALILDENRQVIYEQGMSKSTTEKIIKYVEKKRFDLTWNLYSFDEWISQNKSDARVINEENAVEAESKEGTINSFSENQVVHKILCMCNPEKIIEIEKCIANEFPDCMVVKSSATLLEIMNNGINKANAVSFLCKMWNINLCDVMAFGDNFNDCEMLDVVGHGILMGNAPIEIKKRFNEITADNNSDGISIALKKYKVID